MKQDDGGVAEDMPPPSTQTAALLADLAAEADGLDSAMQLPSSQPLAVSVNCSDYYTPQLHPPSEGVGRQGVSEWPVLSVCQCVHVFFMLFWWFVLHLEALYCNVISICH